MIKNKIGRESNNQNYTFQGIVTFVSLILILWNIFLFRKTIIPIWIPLLIFIISGFLVLQFGRNKIKYLKNATHSYWKLLVYSIVVYGGMTMFCFMALNYFMPRSEKQPFYLRIIRTGELTNNRGCDPTYAVVDYFGFEKELVFPCNTDFKGKKSVLVNIKIGLFGFPIVDQKSIK